MSMHVLFICTGNLCRSPLAEGILKHKLDKNRIGSVSVSSAGTLGLDGTPAAEPAVEVAAQHGIDISEHLARHVTREMLDGADVVVGMERDHIVEADVIFKDTGGKYRLLTDYGPPELRGAEIADPYGGPIKGYHEAYERIEKCVEGLLKEIVRRQ
jgi:protein-tyrosine phosphatase